LAIQICFCFFHFLSISTFPEQILDLQLHFFFLLSGKKLGRYGIPNPPADVNFTNLLAKSATVPAVIILSHSDSPTKLQPTLPEKTTRSYAQLLRPLFFAVRQ